MIPFSSFIQAGSPFADMGAKNTVSADLTKIGAEGSSGAENGNPFWDWLLQLTAADTVTDLDSDVSTGNPDIGKMPVGADWSPFIALIMHAKQQTAEQAGDALNLPADGIEALADIVKQMEATGPQGYAGERPDPDSIHQSLPAFLEKMGIGGPVPESELPRGKADGVPQPERAPAFPNLTAKLNENDPGVPNKGALLPEVQQRVSPVRNPEFEQRVSPIPNPEGKSPNPGETMTLVDQQTKEERFNAAGGNKNVVLAKGNAVDADVDTQDFVPAKNDLSPTNAKAAQAGVDDGRQMRSADNNQFRVRENIREPQLNPSEDVNDNGKVDESAKKETERPILDPAKTAGSDPNRSAESFQATVKTALSGKANPTAAPASNQMDAPAARAFQATVMDQIVEKISLRSFPGRNEMQIRLKPEFLGNVQMHITAEKEQLVVRMVTEHAAVKEIVESHLHHLKTELQSQGLTIDRFDILVNPDAEQHPGRDQFAQMFKQAPSQDEERQEQDQGPDADPQDRDSRQNDDQADEDGINYFA